MATRYGKTFRTRIGRLGRYKYVNGRRVSFQSKRIIKSRSKRGGSRWNFKTGRYERNGRPARFYNRRY